MIHCNFLCYKSKLYDKKKYHFIFSMQRSCHKSWQNCADALLQNLKDEVWKVYLYNNLNVILFLWCPFTVFTHNHCGQLAMAMAVLTFNFTLVMLLAVGCTDPRWGECKYNLSTVSSSTTPHQATILLQSYTKIKSEDLISIFSFLWLLNLIMMG